MRRWCAACERVPTTEFHYTTRQKLFRDYMQHLVCCLDRQMNSKLMICDHMCVNHANRRWLACIDYAVRGDAGRESWFASLGLLGYAFRNPSSEAMTTQLQRNSSRSHEPCWLRHARAATMLQLTQARSLVQT
ncbi:hypothetical protein Y032_0004g2056 [Ancylostoma ceylanicum]|uniref:Uncharacterized protein n=1 Tax=Ancylostoma ceylanicum TaxID=53326 RepID=A0A016VVA4_9BILA|nr:hypothetical protein Y032_0004g2056 [Ancylostoma ceylanicum]